MKKEENLNRNMNFLYKTGAIAAFIAIIVFRRNLSAEMDVFNDFGILEMPAVQPQDAQAWFSLLQRSKITGLLLLNFGDVINYLLVGLLFTAIFAALRKTNRVITTLAFALAIAGIIIFITSNQALPMLSLSRQYADANTDAQRSLLLAAGDELLEIDNPGASPPGMGYLIGLLLVTLSGLIFSLTMLRSGIFNKTTAWMGLLSNGFQLFYFLLLVIAPVWVALPFVLSAPFRITWYVMAALRLLKMN